MLCGFVKEDLENGEDVASCPSCSLIVKVIYDKVSERGPDRSIIPIKSIIINKALIGCMNISRLVLNQFGVSDFVPL